MKVLSKQDADTLAAHLEALAAAIRNANGPVAPARFTFEEEDLDPLDVSSSKSMARKIENTGHVTRIEIEWRPVIPETDRG